MVAVRATAIPIQFTYEGVIDVSVIPGISTGDKVVITVLADNGGTSTVSQSWTSLDLLSATLTAGTYSATYGPPLLTNNEPAFRTDALGVLDRAEFLGGIQGVKSDTFGTGGSIYLFDYIISDYNGDVAFFSDPLSSQERLGFWRGPSAVPVAVPEPMTLTLLASGLVAHTVARRRVERTRPRPASRT